MSDLKPPVARYRLTLTITGNTIAELADELSVQQNNFEVDSLQGRTTRSQLGGRHQLEVTEPNPSMTPDQYDEELDTWHKQVTSNPA